MAKKKRAERLPPAASLRARAEGLLRAKPAELPTLPTADVQTLIHELNVHQIELEIQNDELRQAQLDLAHSRDRYSDLYDFAPVGYLTLDQDGVILEANLTAATMLGTARKQMIGAKLSDWLAPDAQDDFYLHRRSVFSSDVEVKQTCELKMQPAGGEPLVVRFESVLFGSDNGRQCRTALIDVTEGSIAKVELQDLNNTLEQRVADRTREVRLLATAMASLGEGVMITTDHLDWPGPPIVYVNEALCRITGYAAEELIGQTPRMLQGEQTNRDTIKQLRRDLSEGRSHQCEMVNYRKDGTPYDAEMSITPLFDSAGKHINFIAIHRDIGARKKAERQLRASEHKTQAILASLSAHIAVVDQTGTITTVNPAWERFCVENHGTAIRCNQGANYLEVCRTATGAFSDEAPQVAAGLQAILQSKADKFSLEYPCHSATQQHWFLLHITPLHGESIDAVVSHTEITDRVLAEQRLHDREQRLRVILETAADAIVTINQQGIIEEVNKSTLQMFGYVSEELIGQNVKVLMPVPYRDEHDGYLARYLETGQPRMVGSVREIKARRKDGSTFPISLAVSEVAPLGLFTGCIHDISDRVQLQKQVLEIAAEEDRRIGQELHDSIQQQLTGLGLLAQSQAEALVQATRPEADMARRLAQGIRATTNDVHLLARGLVPVEIDAEGLHSALEELAASVSESHTLHCDASCDRRVRVTDNFVATHLYRIAQEAVTNATKHSFAEHIHICLEPLEGGLGMEVLDNGRGFNVDERHHSGVGLSIMQYRANLIGATLQILPAEPSGTRVLCTVH